jgi:D-3-phosphoglycerate dehydrogenase
MPNRWLAKPSRGKQLQTRLAYARFPFIFTPVPRFKVILIEHGYASTQCEREIIEAAGGEFIDAEKLPLEEALRLCEDADGIFCRRLEVTAAIIERFRRCKMLVRYGVGTDNVDVNAATKAGIIVGHVPAYCVDEVSAHAIGLLLTCARRIVPTHRKMEAGEWDVHRGEPIFRMEGRTLGLVGLGRIGQATARKLNGWGLNLLATDPYVEPARAAALGVKLVSLETLCRQSDYLSLHCPLLPETRHLICKRTLALMKPGAMLVNTARGPLVDLTALVAALDSEHLSCAGLDVFEEEPLPADSPLRRHPRLVLTDHTAWYSEESQRELQRTAAEEMVGVCTGGLPLSLANPEVLKLLGRFAEWTPSESALWQLKRAGQ